MSRRKQSNPKPLKRKSEDLLEEVAELLHLPTDLFSVRDPEDDVHEYTLFTRTRVREGRHFGPYGGRVEHPHHRPGNDDARNVIETKGQNGERIRFIVTEDSGGWLKLLKPASSCDVGNVALFYNDSSVWCTITSDIDPETEILVNHRWAGSLTPPRARSPCRPADDRSRPVHEQRIRHRNGSVSSDSSAPKYETTSPASPNSSAASPTTHLPPKLKGEPAECLPYLNGCPPAFPYGGPPLTESMAEGHFKCDVCNAGFNNRRILEVHQAYYCQGKSFTTTTTLSCSDTDTEENTMTKSDSRPAPSPSASEEEGSRDPPKPPSTSPKRLPPRPPPRLFKCPYCTYSTDKKASLTRHVRLHGPSPAECDLPLATPPMARYCANCDIQFASYKNYQVHKEFYCNTRHVHKSTPSSTSPNPLQQHPPPTSQRPPRSPSPQQQQQQQDPSSKNPFVQPLYAAISTSPLILVPCSYVAGGPPGLVPAGNIIIPPSPDAEAPASVIPTFTVGPAAAADKAAEEVAAKEVAAAEKEKMSVMEEGSGEKPLDLSCRKKEEEERKGRLKVGGDAGTRPQVFPSTSSTSSSSEESLPPPPLPPLMPLVTSPLDINLLSRSKIPVLDPGMPPVLPPPPPQVLVKQGTSKCKECNIVFYKHENYLVHKNRYCASRLQPAAAAAVKREATSPPAVKQPDSPGSDREESAPRSLPKSPISSPRVSNPRTPPADPPEPREASPTGAGGPLLQYFCAQCGIKYTSVDNLRAHQLYYCPHRDPPPSQTPQFRCGKCKNAYPSEELLRNHPCGSSQRKCPYCDVYCPTLSAAQRHLVSHTGIKSFRCSLCGYKGHTLRGMRTHIRIHLDKASSTPEEAYILCMDEGGAEIACAGRKAAPPTSPRGAERIKSVIGTEPPPEAAPPVFPDEPVASTDATHWCQICGYSSSYKGNVVRHVKLVHKDLVSNSSMSAIVNSRPSAEQEPAEKIITNGQQLPPEKGVVMKVEAVSPPPPPPDEAPPPKVGEKRTLDDPPPPKGPKYCKSCDISFNYLSNFLAHKKFYCTPRPGEVAGQDPSTTVQSVQ